MWSRRDLLVGLGAAAACGGGEASGPAPSATGGAATLGPARNLIVLQCFGGWDTLYSIDPKPDATWMWRPPGQVRTYGNLPLWADASRPITARFFDDHHDKVAVVHGINVRSVDHTQCLRWMLTGTRDVRAPDVCAIAADALARDYPIPYLLLADRAFLGDLAGEAARAGGLDQIAALVDPGTVYAPLDGTPKLEYTDAEAAAVAKFRAGRTPTGVLGDAVARRADPQAARDRAAILKQYAQYLGSPGLPQDLSGQVDTAVTLLESGVTRAVMLDAQVFYDTHADDTLQERAQEETFGHLSELFQALADTPGREGGSLFDETVVAVVSEMGRAPTLNAANGKDHWPYASILLAGAGIRGDVVLGATSDDGFLGEKLDLATGEIRDDGVTLYAENLVAGLLTAVGADPSPRLPGVAPFRAFLA
jgi:uncharacterized protein (DUF1501 family)